VENGKTEEKLPAYADPSTNEEAAAKEKANCAEEVYSNGGKLPFPPGSTGAVWDEVTTSTKEPHYTICGFSYDLSMSKFNLYKTVETVGGTVGATDEGSRTAFDYINFELEGGQEQIAEGHDYLGLPETAKGHVLKIAREGAAKIEFK